MAHEKLRDKEWLKEQIELLGSQRAVARAYGFGKSVVSKWARIHNLSKSKSSTVKPYRDPEWLKQEYLYRDATIYMNRKYEIARNYMS